MFAKLNRPDRLNCQMSRADPKATPRHTLLRAKVKNKDLTPSGFAPLWLEVREADELSTFARLRNILAHEYLDVTYERIKKFIIASPSIYEIIFKFLSKYISRSESISSEWQ